MTFINFSKHYETPTAHIYFISNEFQANTSKSESQDLQIRRLRYGNINKLVGGKKKSVHFIYCEKLIHGSD